MKLSNGKGYYIIPSSRTYPDIFIVFTQVKKTNVLYDDIVNKHKSETKDKTKKLRKYMILKTNKTKKTKVKSNKNKL